MVHTEFFSNAIVYHNCSRDELMWASECLGTGDEHGLCRRRRLG